jgi:hypothetical protein
MFSVFLELICYAYSTPVMALSVADLQKTIKESHVSAFLCHHVAEAGPRKLLSRAFFWVKSPGYKPSLGGLGKVEQEKDFTDDIDNVLTSREVAQLESIVKLLSTVAKCITNSTRSRMISILLTFGISQLL